MAVTRQFTRTGSQATPGTKIDADIDNTNNYVNAHEASTAAHGATGANVGSTNTQTLTNKTINSVLTNTTTDLLNITGSSITTAALADINSDSADTTARQLVKIINDNTAATGAVCLYIKQDSTGDMIQCYDGATKVLSIDDEGALIISS